MSRELSCVALAFWRFGPYHLARFKAAARRLPLVGIQFGTYDEYAWESDNLPEGIITLVHGQDVKRPQIVKSYQRLSEVIGALSPAVVALPGWSDPISVLLLCVLDARKIPFVLMSDSTFMDSSRSSWKEMIKKRIVRFAGAGLVAGERSGDYLRSLGLPSERVFFGYDVVDNSHFARRSIAGGRIVGMTKGKKFFLSVGRFIGSGKDVGVKNFERLIDAYQVYLKKAPHNSWDLVILGDGDGRSTLERARASTGLGDRIHFPGFAQYQDMPRWYESSSVFILPSVKDTWGLVVNEAMAASKPVLVSNRCGCVPDLVRDGVNGFTFDPNDVEGIARLMFKMAHGGVDLETMGRAGRTIIADWSPERFADGLEKAVEAALRVGPKRQSFLDRAVLLAMMRR